MIYDFLSRYGPVGNTQTSQISDIKDLQFKYLGLYFTAVWCSSCVRTSESLKNAVAKINNAHPNLFKMITIRLDESSQNLGYYYWRFPQLNYNMADELSKNLAVRYLPSWLSCQCQRPQGDIRAPLESYFFLGSDPPMIQTSHKLLVTALRD